MSTLRNLIVDLRDERYGAHGLDEARTTIARFHFKVDPSESAAQDVLAWIDDEFGGTWSSETFAGASIVARRGAAIAGFATYDPQGLKFSWLREWRARSDVGIFGPFGVAAEFRGSPLGPALLQAALCGLRARGYAFALVPAVGNETLIRYYQKHADARVIEEIDRSNWSERRVPTTVLASGSGTNFQAVLDAIVQERLPLQINALITNRQDAGALQRAAAAQVPTRLVLPWVRTVQTRQAYDDQVVAAVSQTEPELLLLLGWMHILPEHFIRAFPQTINIHPAFLPLDQRRDVVVMPDGGEIPAFRGAHAVADALASGARWTGASSHLVTLDTDRGPVLVRKPLAIGDANTVETVMERLRPIEHRVLLGGIMRWVLER